MATHNETETVKRSVVSLVYDAISDRITEGGFSANERLTEAKLMKEFNVSRGAIRETMSKLAAEGLIVLEPNKGAVVRAISRQDFADFLQVRMIFESFAAQRAAERINELGARELVSELIAECDSIETNPSPEALIDNDTNFHNALMDLSGNAIMASEWRRLRKSRHRIGFLRSQSKADVVASVRQHREILLAILDGNGELASQLATDHIKMVNSRIQRLRNDAFNALFNTSSSSGELTEDLGES